MPFLKALIMKYLLFLSVVCFLSCNKNHSNASFSSLKVNSCESNLIGGNKVKICLLKVEADSRCPLNAYCIHKGFVTAKFSVKINESVADTILLDMKNYESVNPSEIIIEGYKISFQTLSPYPGEVGYSYNNLKAGLFVEQ